MSPVGLFKLEQTGLRILMFAFVISVTFLSQTLNLLRKVQRYVLTGKKVPAYCQRYAD